MLFAVLSAMAAPEGPILWEPLDTPRPIEAQRSLYLPELTWMEVRDARDAGMTTVLVPTGGIEQNGPYLALDKHDHIARAVALGAAERLGDALVAPVISFVPEGSVAPATGHMRYPGTISVRESTFADLLEDVVRSLDAHGFQHIALLGDSGGSQAVQAQVAARLDRWLDARVHHIPDFYDPEGANAVLAQRGLVASPDVYHDDPGFTFQLLAIDPAAARLDERARAGQLVSDGILLDADAAAHGRAVLDWRAQRTADAVSLARGSPRAPWWGPAVQVARAPLDAVLTQANQRVFWLYLVTALVAGFLAEAWNLGRDWSIPEVLRRLFPARVWLSRDARNDLLFALCGGIAAFTLIPGAFGFLHGAAQDAVIGALRLSGVGSLDLAMSTPLVLVFTLAVILATDLGVYLAHLAQHRIPILWTFHKTHHAARQLTPMQVFRQHPVDLLLNGLVVAPLAGAATGLLTWLVGGPPTVMAFGGLNAVIFVFYLGAYNLRHSHVWLSFGPLERVLISPAMHQIHHSEAPEHWDKNMGLVFSVWDQLFGTAYLPERREQLQFGIGPESERFRTPLDFLLVPVREALGLLPPLDATPAAAPSPSPELVEPPPEPVAPSPEPAVPAAGSR